MPMQASGTECPKPVEKSHSTAECCWPKTVEQLYYAVATTDEKKNRSVFPFKEWTHKKKWPDALKRVTAFLEANAGEVVWVPINNNVNNDGPTSINACRKRSLAERLTNGIDAVIERALWSRDPNEPLPTSPCEAVEQFFGITPETIAFGWSDSRIRELANSSVQFRAFPNEETFDIRDFGIGILPEDMPGTILSLNRANKQGKHYLTGKHGQGAANTFQFSQLTVIASRHVESDEVGFTLVRQSWHNADGSERRTPSYEYMTMGGKIPRLKAPKDFLCGTLVRHVGYGNLLFGRQGQNSIYGLSQRMLVNALLPVVTEVCSSEPTQESGNPRARYYPHLHVAKGSIHQLNRNQHYTLHGSKKDYNKIRAHNVFSYHLGNYDFGGFNGKIDIGTVRFAYWVMCDQKRKEGETRPSQDAVKNFADPFNPIMFTLDGQNHGEEPRALITAERHAGLWSVGKWTIVQVDCNDLHPRAVYDLFTSTRERTKDTPIKKMIEDALVSWLANDEQLQEWNIRLASGKEKTDDTEKQDSWIAKLDEHLNRIVDLPKIRRRRMKIEKGQKPRGRKTLEPIFPQNPPTFVRWGINNDLTTNQQFARVRMYPGQVYSWNLETDAPADYWHPDGRKPKSEIVLVSDNLVLFKGGENMKGGRVRCRFECSDDMSPGDTGLVLARLYDPKSRSPIPISTAELHIEVVAKPDDGKPGGKRKNGGDDNNTETWVEEVFNILQPEPITRENHDTWTSLEWGNDVSKAGFALKKLGGQFHLFYNAEFPEFLDLKRCLEPFGLTDAFVDIFELNLVVHAAIALNNNDLPDEDSFIDPSGRAGPSVDEQRDRIHAYYAAVVHSLAIASSQEVKMQREVNKHTK